MKHYIAIALFLVLAVACFGFDVSVSVNTETDRAQISPYIYGANQLLTDTENWASARLGGNRMTGYNWENNASNAGADWQHSSDNYMCTELGVPSGQYETAGSVLTTFHDSNLAKSRYSIVTIQMAGYVAKDKNGTVAESEVAPSARWCEVMPAKGSAFAYPPNTGDSVVYIDELVSFIVSRYGTAKSANGLDAYCIDNEPALWSSTHPRIHPAQATCVEVKDKAVNMAKAIKAVDPDAELYGPVLYGFSAYNDFQGAPDWASVKGSYAWFIDYYLDNMKNAGNTAGKRLIDVLDVHWYPEAIGGGVRITFNGTGSADTCKARIQAPRTLWDPSYCTSTNREDSWIAQYFIQFLPLIPRIQQSISSYYPGTKLSITEYNYGGEADISGGIAMADVLGIFGKFGLYTANYWKIDSTTTYTTAALKIYRNYDGASSTYGNTKVYAESNNSPQSSVYASIEGDSNARLHMILINKDYDNTMNANVSVSSSTSYTTAQVYAFDSTTSNPTAKSQINVTNNSFTYALPKLSVYHFVLSGTGGTPAPTPEVTPVPGTRGDVNGSGSVDIVDALLIAQFFVGLNPANFNQSVADVNCSSSIDIVDALLVAQYFVGLITSFPC